MVSAFCIALGCAILFPLPATASPIPILGSMHKVVGEGERSSPLSRFSRTSINKSLASLAASLNPRQWERVEG
jgi:hypothetical protein